MTTVFIISIVLWFIAVNKLMRDNRRLKRDNQELYGQLMNERLKKEDLSIRSEQLFDSFSKANEENKVLKQQIEEKTFAFNQCEKSLKECHALMNNQKSEGEIDLSDRFGGQYEFVQNSI